MPAAPSALLLLLLCLSTSAACVAALSQAAARGEGQGGVGHRRAALSEAAAADRPRGGLLLTWGVGGPERLGRHGDTALPLPVREPVLFACRCQFCLCFAQRHTHPHTRRCSWDTALQT